MDSTSAFRQRDPSSNPIAGTKICKVCPSLGILQPQWKIAVSLGFLQPQWKTAVSAGLLDSTSAFRQGDLGESHNRHRNLRSLSWFGLSSTPVENSSERWSIGLDLGLLSGRPGFESHSRHRNLGSLCWFGHSLNPVENSSERWSIGLDLGLSSGRQGQIP